MKTRAQLEQENHQIESELAQIRQALLSQESRYEAALEAKNQALESKDQFIEQLKQALILERNARFAASSESLAFPCNWSYSTRLSRNASLRLLIQMLVMIRTKTGPD